MSLSPEDRLEVLAAIETYGKAITLPHLKELLKDSIPAETVQEIVSALIRADEIQFTDLKPIDQTTTLSLHPRHRSAG